MAVIQDQNLSSFIESRQLGFLYPTPVLDGGAKALRWGTFLNLYHILTTSVRADCNEVVAGHRRRQVTGTGCGEMNYVFCVSNQYKRFIQLLLLNNFAMGNGLLIIKFYRDSQKQDMGRRIMSLVFRTKTKLHSFIAFLNNSGTGDGRIVAFYRVLHSLGVVKVKF
eukprot:scaffold1849_cov115-Cylindrotheca_fusiformis.AAC.10